ncbi:MAG TPA: energy-coupling factor transporter ATPase [Candidatus Merdivicinus faecavium]|nr:energy-coupling factor transporter ATPase [Candidatus Merdivicinus faecavium]
MGEPIINATQVYFDYQNEEDGTVFPVLKGIDLKIRDGEFVAVLGHNGSGKSTFAKHCNAILLPTSGDVLVAGINTKEEDRLFDIRQNVGMVFQNPDNQIVATIVEEDVAFALENMGVEPAEIRRRVDEALKQVEMYEYREHAPHQLSGGQKQRVAIAGILAMRPRCIVLDEPTAMLDPKGRREVMKTIRQLNREHGTTVVLITHYMEEAAVSDRVVVIDNGEVLRDGTPKQVFSEVELLKSVGLDVPQVTELVYELRKEGVDLPQDILTEEECYEAIKGLLTKGDASEGNDKT